MINVNNISSVSSPEKLRTLNGRICLAVFGYDELNPGSQHGPEGRALRLVKHEEVLNKSSEKFGLSFITGLGRSLLGVAQIVGGIAVAAFSALTGNFERAKFGVRASIWGMKNVVHSVLEVTQITSIFARVVKNQTESNSSPASETASAVTSDSEV